MSTTLDPSSLDALTETFSAVTLDALSEAELRERLDLARQLEGLAAVGMARVVDRLSRAGAPRRDGASSLRGWVQQQTGRSTAEAARLTRLAGGLPRTGGLVPQLTVHVDLATITASFDDTDGTGDDSNDTQPPRWDDPRWDDAPAGRTGFGHDLSAQAIRQLLCDAAVTRVVTDGASQPLDVGRATRTWTNAQRRYVNHRDRGCRGPACERPAAWTRIHHITWWRHGGETSTGNALSLCHACHTLVHDDSWHPVLEPDDDVTWTAPDGRTVIARSRPD